MSNDIDKLIEIIEKENKYNHALYPYEDMVCEIVDLIKQEKNKDKLLYDLLVEIFKYIKFSNTWFYIDYDIDMDIKYDAINNIKLALENKKISDKDIEALRNVNEQCLSCILDPLKNIRMIDDYCSKHSDEIT